MPDFDYATLEEGMLAACRECIAEFAEDPRNREVHIFVFAYDAVSLSPLLKWNSEEGLRQLLRKESYQSYSGSKIYGVRGLRYSSGDFPFDAAVGRHAKVRELWEEYERRLNAIHDEEEETGDFEFDFGCEEDRLRELFVRVVRRLEPDFAHFHKTEDFVAYVCDWQRPHEDWLTTMLETVTPERMSQLFSGFAEAERMIAEIRRQPPEEELRFWLRQIDAEKTRANTPLVEALTKHGREAYPIMVGRIVELRSEAPQAILQVGQELESGQLDSTLEDPDLVRSRVGSLLGGRCRRR